MKSVVIKAGLLTCLLFGIINQEASAESKLGSKCSSLGKIEQNQNPSFQQINCLLTNAAIEANIPPEVVKAVASQESGWVQFKNNEPYISTDNGIGIMQVTDRPEYLDVEKLKYDIIYNIEAGVKILSDKYAYKHLPKIKGAGRHEIENWYFPVMAYNGTKATNSPIYQKTGEKNKDAYQEKVFSYIEKDSFLTDTKTGTILTAFPFKSKDFVYESNDNITFLKKEYTLTNLHTSAYFLKKGDQVIVTVYNSKLRYKPTTSSEIKKTAPKNTILTITNDFSYEVNSTSNQFVWFPVKSADRKLSGNISSAYIKKWDASSAPSKPEVKEISDRSTVITGKAESNTTVIAEKEGKIIGKATAKNGKFSINIKKQSAGTLISIYAKDASGNISESTPMTVIDKTPPAKLTVSKVTSKQVMGKSEKGATITIKKGKTEIGKTTVNKNGNYTVKIKPQKKGSYLTIIAKDKAGNKKEISKKVE